MFRYVGALPVLKRHRIAVGIGHRNEGSSRMVMLRSLVTMCSYRSVDCLNRYNY